MNIKGFIKSLSSSLFANFFGLKHRGKGVYIGIGAKLVNASRIYAGNFTEFTPYSMVVCLGKDSEVHIGHHSRVSMFSRIGAHGKVRIGNNVEMGPNVFIADFNHAYKDVTKPIMFQGITPPEPLKDSDATLEIGDDCWIGTNTTIVGSLRIGKHCVIGANSVVNTNIPDFSVAVGAPAKVIKRYNVKTEMWEKV